MTTFNTVNFQLIMVIVVTAVSISIADNIIDARYAELEAADRRIVSENLVEEQRLTQRQVAEHVAVVDAHANVTSQILEEVRQIREEQNR
jgi:hypothetical protein